MTVRFPMQLSDKSYLGTFLPIILALWLVGCQAEWNRSSIGNSLGVDIPADATEVTWSGHPERGGSLELSFKAPPDSVSIFTKEICDGLLHKAYDPFDSIESTTPFPNSVLVKGHIYVHYSYSVNTPETTFGTRCQSDKVIQMVVDQSVPNLHSVRLSIPNFSSNLEPPIYPSVAYVTPILGSGFPLMAVGVRTEGEEFIQEHDEICIETRLGNIFQGWDNYVDDLRPFFDSQVNISVDDQVLTPAVIPGNSANLIPLNDSGAFEENPYLWNYCIYGDWSIGTHIMRLEVTKPSGENNMYSWSFQKE